MNVGEKAPNFMLPGIEEDISIDFNQGKNTILVFYPKDGTKVCSNQLALYNEILSVFVSYNAELFGISVDNIEEHKKFKKNLNLKFPLLSDENPKGSISKRYEVYNENTGVSERALFVIDNNGIIKWKYISPAHINPGAEGILQALEEIKQSKK